MTFVRGVHRLRLRSALAAMIVALAVMVVALASCKGVLASPSETAPASLPATAPATQPATQPAAGAGQPLPLPEDNGQEPLPTMPEGPGPWWHMLASVIVILVLGGVALVVIKKFIPRLAVSTGKKISVLETIYLGPRLSVHLVDVAGQRFLLASTRDCISMLAEVAGAVGEDAEGQGETSP